ncbi:hypothetical protein FHR32_004400 [Streptosporangium album]|uniref:Protein kinase domain-containing protein n=1 Tax=Streptosporangium album TaxID=47479 RepID=A0A7W7WBB4_9ACTN|nr:hypothetical protein [Streptosporangium album]MBB4940095.1 hypothetical protein [Streptosporangium album]
MNHPDVPPPQGRHSGRHNGAGPVPGGAPSPAVLEQVSLEQTIGRLGPMAPQQVAAVGLAVLDQLVTVHNQGMLHGDVRPGSVLIGPHDQIVLGTPTFRSPTFTAPEGVTGPAADLWSLGATLYTAVEGRPPSPGGSLDNAGPIGPMLFRLLSGDPAQRPDPGTLRNALLDISRNGGAAPAPADTSSPMAVPPSPEPSSPHLLPAPFPASGPRPVPAGADPDVTAAVLTSAASPPPEPPFDPAATLPPQPAFDLSAPPRPSPALHGHPSPPPHEVPASQDLVQVSPPPRVSSRGEETGPTERSGSRGGVLVPRPIVALTGVLLVGMAVTVGVLLTSASGESAPASEPATGAGAGAKGLFSTVPRACSLLDEKQADEVVPGFRSSEVETGACDWLNQLDWRKPSTEKFDLRVRLVAQKPDASGVQRAKEFLAGKKTDSVESGKFATPKPAPPQTLKGIGEEAYSTGGYSSINLYGGSYKSTVVFRVGNLTAQVDYERGGVKEDSDGKIAEGAQQVARWLTQSLKTDG